MLGVVVFFVAGFLPSGGLTLVALAVIVAGIATLILAPAMPARTLAGAMLRAMLAAYRRSLEKTIALSRSLDAAVEGARLPWLEAPDQLLVWGTALGLQDELDALLARAVEDVNSGAVPAGSTYLPVWYATSAAASSGGSGSGSTGGLTSPVSGLMSASAIPNFGAMFAVLGTIGDSVVVSSSSGGSGSSSSSSSQQLRRRQLGRRRRWRRRRLLSPKLPARPGGRGPGSRPNPAPTPSEPPPRASIQSRRVTKPVAMFLLSPSRERLRADRTPRFSACD